MSARCSTNILYVQFNVEYIPNCVCYFSDLRFYGGGVQYTLFVGSCMMSMCLQFRHVLFIFTHFPGLVTAFTVLVPFVFVVLSL